MFCTNCGTFNENRAKLCAHCCESLGEVPGEENPLSLREATDKSLLKKIDFLRGLFDFSSNQLVSPSMMKLLYALSVLSAGLIAFLLVFIGFNASLWFGMVALLIGAPLIFLFSVVSSRVLLETILVIFHMRNPEANIGEKSELRDDIHWRI